VSIVRPQHEIERFYRLIDVLVLPSYREGFPNVPLEAAAMEVPVITTNALGCVDAVKDGETGIVVPVRNAGAPAEAMLRLGRDPELRARMGLVEEEARTEVRSPMTAGALAW
jgi:glycosyltransferase involved in cell wall biosynthesis